MAGTIEQKLAALDVVLHAPASPIANYVGFVRTGNLLIVSGQVCFKAAIGDLDKVVRVVRLGGFINSAPDFLDGPKVLNGASDLMVAVFGDKGRHARTTVGVASLPADAAVEVEGIFEVS
jgi:enamine deaminase RidA (YjgF/YER057c/UK114 family)